MANSVHWYGYVLKREDGDVVSRKLDIVVDGERKRERLKRTWNKQVKEESMNAGLHMEDALFYQR